MPKKFVFPTKFGKEAIKDMKPAAPKVGKAGSKTTKAAPKGGKGK